MKKKTSRVTIRDVANLVGVHHSTVSRALNSNSSAQISPAVVKKVKKAADSLGYYPNIVASSLKQNRSFALGVLIPDLMNPVFPPIIRGIQDVADGFGYSIITVNTDDDEVREMDALRMMQGRSIEGMLVATAQREDEIVNECIKRHIPFVLLNRTIDAPGVNAVITDEKFGVQSALDHLIGLGHRNIAHVAGPEVTSTGFSRAREFSAYMASQGLQADLCVLTEKFTVEEGYTAFRNLMAKGKKITAILASNDLIALGCMDAITEMGRRIPQDISVVGYNDIPFMDRMDPPLTTVAISKYAIGEAAANMLFEMLSDERTEPEVKLMKPRLIVRGSTSAPNKN